MSRASAADLEELGLRMDESQGNEFRKSTGFLLNFAEQKQMPHPVFGRLGVSAHHRRRGGNPAVVRGPNHLDPLANFQLIWTHRSAHIVVDNFSGWSRETVQNTFLQSEQV